MIKKRITYTDYNGVERIEDFYFNLSTAEITEMEASTEEGYGEKLMRIVDSQSKPEMFAIFKEFIAKSYGIKSEDGKQFRKSKEITDSFMQSEAYSILLLDITQNEGTAVEFINGIMPKNIPDTRKTQIQQA